MLTVSGIQDHPPGSLADCLETHAAATPERQAVVDADISLSYRDLSRLVDETASHLARLGACEGSRICFLGPPGLQYLATLLACLRLRAVWTGLNPRYTVPEMAHVLQDLRPFLILAADGCPAGAAAILREAAAGICDAGIVSFGSGVEGMIAAFGQAEPALPKDRDRAADGVCLIVYTSGTTGRPKGARIKQSGLAENGWWLARRLGFKPHRTLVNLPVSHIGCVGDICATVLICGGTFVFMRQFSAADAVRLIREQRISWLAQVPAQLQLIFAETDAGGVDFASLECVTWGGAAMPAALVEQLYGRIPDLFNSYGQTECSGTITLSEKGADVAVLAGSVGRAVDPARLRITDETGAVATRGVSGELQIRGPHVFAGYLNQAGATRAAFTDDGWLKTGDIGREREDGNIELIGRTHDMLKSGGYNVYPREVELAIETMAGVEMCAVVSRADPLWGEVGIAFVQADPVSVAPDALRDHCSRLLARYKIPKQFIVRPDLPLLPVGKIDRAALKALVG